MDSKDKRRIIRDGERVRFLLGDDIMAANFVYRPPENDGPPVAQNATPGVKFAQSRRILDDWWLLGGTRWTRTLFRLKHPIVYSKRGLRSLGRRIKKYFFGEPPSIIRRRWITKEEMLKEYPNNKETHHGTD